MRDVADVDAYLEVAELWPDEIRTLRPVLQASGLDETVKWGKPCYALDGANVAIVQEFSGFLALMFFKGVLLDDPAGVLEDQGPNTHGAKRMTFRSVAEVEDRLELVADYLARAIEVERAGTPLPPRPEQPLVEELQERLADDPELAAAFDGLTPGRQREYDLHVSSAKQAATRRRRVEAVVPRILEGRGLRDR